jgi:hypothetical protein
MGFTYDLYRFYFVFVLMLSTCPQFRSVAVCISSHIFIVRIKHMLKSVGRSIIPVKFYEYVTKVKCNKLSNMKREIKYSSLLLPTSDLEVTSVRHAGYYIKHSCIKKPKRCEQWQQNTYKNGL